MPFDACQRMINDLSTEIAKETGPRRYESTKENDDELRRYRTVSALPCLIGLSFASCRVFATSWSRYRYQSRPAVEGTLGFMFASANAHSSASSAIRLSVGR